MHTPTMTDAEEEQLLDDLADALQQLVETSCAEMAPLWLAGTRLARRDLTGTTPDLDIELSEACRRLSRGTQNRYRGLACWRHALLWKRILPELDDVDYARATHAIYFTPYPEGTPPYAWSRRVSDAPDAAEFMSPQTLKDWAKEGCWRSVEALRTLRRRLPEQSVLDEVVHRLLATASRDTLRDVLKLDDHPAWSRP